MSPPYPVTPDPTGLVRSRKLQSYIDYFDSLNGEVQMVLYWEAALNSDGYFKDYRMTSETGKNSAPVWAAACLKSRLSLEASRNGAPPPAVIFYIQKTID